MTSSAILEPFGDAFWLLEGDPLRMYGIPFTTRSVVVRLASGGLFLWSPVAPSPERFEAVAALGPLEHIVAPNTLHHLYLPPWIARFPEAKVWGAPRLAAKRPDVAFDGELGDMPNPMWAADLDQVDFKGSRALREIVFFHRPSKTTIITDIVQNHDPADDNWFWRGVKRMTGILAPNGSAPRDYRLTVTDRKAARAAAEHILGWPTEQVVLAHGINVTEDAHAFLRHAFAWLDPS
jgi:hypothetical protein